MLIKDGWLQLTQNASCRVQHQKSNFFNERPADVVIDALIIHNISLPAGEFKGSCVEDLFMGCLNTSRHPSLAELNGVEVSAHLFIRRNGEVIQFVSFDDRAWHAGVSTLSVDGEEREGCNDFSIGIELEGADTVPYTLKQYQSLAELTQTLMNAYPISTERIVGHNDIAPGRKTDPGESFDWAYFKNSLKKYDKKKV